MPGHVARGLLALLALAGALPGCRGEATGAPSAPAPASAAATTAAPAQAAGPVADVGIDALEYQFLARDVTAVAAGQVSLTLRNLGLEQHHGQLLRLRGGVGEAEVAAALTADPSGRRLLGLGEPAGGPGLVGPGRFARTTQRLAPGSYAMVCLIRGPGGGTHAASGMVALFEVVKGQDAEPPRPDAEAGLRDHRFELPPTLPRRGVLRVTNRGRAPHELTILRLPAGKGLAGARPYLRALGEGPPFPPPPFDAAGGVAAIAPGASALLQLDLAPGTYLAICLVPSGGGRAHASLGMVREFRVR